MSKTESRLFRSFFMIIAFVAMMTLAGFLTVASADSKAISGVTYPFTYTTGVSLEDVSTGSTQLIGPNLSDYRSALTDIGFDFWLDGSHYSQFSVSSHGLMRLGSELVVTNYQNLLASTVSLPKVVPYWDDLYIGTNGQVHYKVLGTAPTRKLVVEWMNLQVPRIGPNNPGAATFQVWLWESTGIIEFVYGEGMAENAANSGYSVGFGSSSTVLASVTTATPSVAYGTANDTQTNAITSGTKYTFTPLVPADPTNLTFSDIGFNEMTLHWNDNASNELGYAIYNSTDGTTYTFVGQEPANAVSSIQSGLLFDTMYWWEVFAVTEGALSQTAATGTQSTNAGSIIGTLSVGPTGDYASLTAAFADINTRGLLGPVILELQASYVSSVETFPLTTGRLFLNSAVNTVTVRPASGATGLSITSADSTTTFSIDGDPYGCSNLIIDGRPAGVGSTKHLTIGNTGTGSALRFINEASNNSIMWVTLQAVTTATDSGVVVFGTTTGSSGNDNNLIDYCDIRDGATTPRYGIYSLGTTTTSARNNSGNVISNCNIYNVFVSNGVDAGIYLAAGTTEWTINGNSFFQQEARTATATANRYAIYINNNAGTGFVVSGNFIGGSAASAGGGAWTLAGAYDNRFAGIQLYVGTTPVSSVQGNTITNFNWYSTAAAAALVPPGVWIGIYVQAGSADIGTTTGNTIGAATGNGSIVVTHNSSGKTSFGIGSISTSQNTIANNTVGSISVYGSTSLISHSFTGIQVTAGSNAITNNTIGSLTTPDSLYAALSTHTTSLVLTGILSTSTGTNSISGNIVANLYNGYNGTGSAGQVRGIASTTGYNTITDNVVRNLVTTSLNASGTNQSSSVVGISQASTYNSQTVSRNIVHSLVNTITTSAAVKMIGIYYVSGTSSVLSHNFIHSLSLSSTSTTAYFYGIVVNGGTSSVYNNMVRIGLDSSGNSISSNYPIRGIHEQTGTNEFSFNSSYVGGSVETAGTNNTYAFYSAITTATTRAYRNNIFVNGRTNVTGTGNHVAAYYGGTLPNPAGLTSDYNLYIASGTGAALVHNGTTYYTSLFTWQTASGLDASSLATSDEAAVNFVNSGGTSATVNLHVQSPTVIEGGGTDIAYVTDDYDGQLRSTLTPVDIGADAGEFTAPDISPPTIVYTILADTVSLDNPSLNGVEITDASGVNTTSGTKPRLYYKRSSDANAWNDNTSGTAGWKFVETIGSSSPFSFTIDYAKLEGGTISYSTVVQYFIVAQDLATPVNVAINSGEFAVLPVSVDLTATAFPIGAPLNSYTIYQPVSGTKTVCASGCDYATLTGPGGAFDSINAVAIVGNLDLQIAGDLISGETGAIALNALREMPSGSGFTLKIYPVGVARAITSTTNPTGGFIRLNGADNVTIDGSLGGNGTDRNMTISQKNTGTSGVVIWLHNVASTTDGATGNTIRNLNIVGNSNTTTLFGIGMGGTTTPSITNYGTNNNYNTIRNNAISRVKYGIYTKGLNATTKNTGNVITLNMLNAESPDNIAIGGILVGYEDAVEISLNVISGMAMAATADVFGISLGLTTIGSTAFSGHEVTNATVIKNIIGSVTHTGTLSAVGIAVATSTSGTTLIANNSIWGVSSTTTTSASEFAAGIVLGGGAVVTKIYYNSISMTGTLSGGASPSYALAMGGTSPVPTVNVRNNILYNTQVHGTGLSLAIGMQTGTFTNLTSDYNDLYVGSGDYFFVGKTGGLAQAAGVNRLDLAAWQSATGKDANSLSADPLFTSASDLLPGDLSPVMNAGTPVEVTDDINGNERSLTTPSIGAYDFDTEGPAISYVPLEETASTVDRTLTVSVIDSSGVPTTGAGLPMLYFRKGTAGVFASFQCVHLSGDDYSCSTDYSQIGGVTGGDVIEYYVAAQDSLGNVSIKPPEGADGLTASPPAAGTPPTTPENYFIYNLLYDFEATTDQGFTQTSLTSGHWERGQPSGGNGAPTSARSGLNLWGTILSGDYEINSEYILYSPMFQTTGTQVLWVFYEYYNTEANVDYMYPEYRINGGSWTEAVAPYAGTQNTWSRRELTISTAVEDIVEFRFRLVTNYIRNFAGWYIDDMMLAGAVEVDLTAPMITYTPLENTVSLLDRTLTISVTDESGVPTSGIGLPVLYFRKGTSGSYVSTQCVYQSGDAYDCTTDYSLLGGVNYGDVIQYYVAAQDTMDNVSVRPESGAGDFTANPPAAGTPPTVPDSYVTAIVLSGSYDVGSGQTYSSLTNPDGVFDVINRSILGGDLTINITSNLNAETGSIGLNPFNETGVGGYTLTIKPTGASRVIQGTGTNDAVIRLLGADRVVIDGSLSGGTDRSLTIDNPNSTDTGAVVILIGSLGPGLGAENVTIKNCIIEGGTIGSASITTFGIHVGSSVGGYEGDDNDNLTILNNQIIGATIGIQAYGTTSGTLDGLVITGNLLGDVSSPASLGQIGLSLGACNNATVSDNTIMNVSCGFNNAYGIVLGSGFAQSVVSRNFISGISHTGTVGYGGVGIHVNTGATAENIIIANNMVSGMGGDGSITTDRSICGIHLDGTSTGVKVLFNSVNLGSGPYVGYDAATLSGALIIESTVTNSDIRNNVLVSNLENTTNAGAKTYAILSKTDYLGFSFIDNNDYHVSGPQGVLGSLNATDLTTLAAWRAATQQDPLSLSVAPSFASATDLHLETGVATWLESSGVSIIAVSDDFDAETRHATRPDIGADEGTFPPVLDMGVTTVDVPTPGGSIIAGTSFTPTATFTNYGRIELTDVVVRFRIVGPAPSTAEVYNETLTIGSLAILASTQRSFPSTTIYYGRAYTMYVSTEASGDMVPENDEISGNLTVLPTIDLESTAVNDPLSGSTKTAGISFVPAAVFHNGGLVTLNDAPVRLRIVGPSPQVTEVYNQTAVIPTIVVDEYLQVEFPAVSESAFPIAGTYTAYALSEQSGDEQPNNDQASATFSVNVVGTVGANPADHLRLTKNTGTPLTVNLTWGASCGTAATDYAIYEGAMGTWYSHASTVCTTSGGLSSLNYTPGTGNRYFLIVPLSTSLEGSYGQRSNGVERPVGTGACIATQNTAACEGAKARRVFNPEATAPVEDDLTSLPYWDEANAYGGYQLLTAGRTTVLLDREGNAVKSWPEANATRTLHGGTTFTRFTDEESGFSGFREIDENGSVVREYLETRPDYHLHGDFIRIFNRKLNDYTLLYLAARDLTPGQSIAAGCNPDGRACDRAQAATIVEVDSFGQIVWEWSFIDHIDLPVRSTHTGHTVSKGPADRFSGRLDMSDPRLTLGRGWPTSTFLFYNEELGHIVVNSALEEFHVIDHAASFIVGDPEGSIKRAASPAGDFIHRFPDTTRH